MVHFYMLTGSTSLGMDVQYSTWQRLHHRAYASNTLPGKEPSQNAISGHYQPYSEMPLKWRFTVRPIVVHFYMLTGSTSLGMDVQYSTRQRLHHRVYVSNTLPDKEPSQHAISGHYQPYSEMPLKWRFTVRPIVVHFYMLTGSTSLGMDVQYSTRQRLHHRVYVSNTLPDKEPSQHAISGHY